MPRNGRVQQAMRQRLSGYRSPIGPDYPGPRNGTRVARADTRPAAYAGGGPTYFQVPHPRTGRTTLVSVPPREEDVEGDIERVGTERQHGICAITHTPAHDGGRLDMEFGDGTVRRATGVFEAYIYPDTVHDDEPERDAFHATPEGWQWTDPKLRTVVKSAQRKGDKCDVVCKTYEVGDVGETWCFPAEYESDIDEIMEGRVVR